MSIVFVKKGPVYLAPNIIGKVPNQTLEPIAYAPA